MSTWIELNYQHLAHNLQLLQSCAPGVPLWPAVKANAYGHGATEICHSLRTLGIETFCVANAEEALALIERGISARYLVLSPQIDDPASEAIGRGIEFAIGTFEQLSCLQQAAHRAQAVVNVHISVDTGMTRGGIDPSMLERFLADCDAMSHVHVAGVMTHFPCADDPAHPLAERQLTRFQALKTQFKQHLGLTWHIANSAGLMRLEGAAMDAARPGIALYGLNPFNLNADVERATTLRPVLDWYARVTHLAEVPAGTGISYGHRFVTATPSLIATLAIGYGDGLARNLSDRIAVTIRGQRCPQVGIITMDQCLVDVSALRGQINLGDTATLIGSAQGDNTAMDFANLLGTIHYEIVTNLSPRVVRKVVGIPSIT